MHDADDLTGGALGAALHRELRRMPRAGESGRARVMHAVRREAARPRFAFMPRWKGERPGWISPVLGASLAATMLVAASLGTQLDMRRAAAPSHPGAISAALRDTLMLVRFALHAPSAGRVALVGDFNSWRRDRALLHRDDADGTWVATVALGKGEHRYAFVVDDTMWIVDPASRANATAGRVSSRLVVPEP